MNVIDIKVGHGSRLKSINPKYLERQLSSKKWLKKTELKLV